RERIIASPALRLLGTGPAARRPRERSAVPPADPSDALRAILPLRALPARRHHRRPLRGPPPPRRRRDGRGLRRPSCPPRSPRGAEDPPPRAPPGPGHRGALPPGGPRRVD